MKASSILLERNKTQIISMLKGASKTIVVAALSLFLLISIIGLKAFKTELGYKLTKSKNHDVVITTGGTGLTGRDNTIDAIKKISEIEIPGFGELFRQLSYNKIGTSTIQSRSSAFLVNKKYIFCLPGSSSAVRDAWNDILFYQLDVRHKPCNFIELIPRLDE